MLAGCAVQPALTPRELNASPAKYDGKKVRVRGWLVIQFEQYHFWDSKAASESPTSGANTCVSYLGPIHRTTGKMAILEGTFWKDFAKSLNVIDLGTCDISGLDVDNQPPADQIESNRPTIDILGEPKVWRSWEDREGEAKSQFRP